MISTLTNENRTRVNKDLARVIGNRVRQARINKGMSQGALAEILGMSQPNFGVKEKGDGNFAPHDLIKICRVLDVDPNHIYFWDSQGLDDEDEKLLKAMKKLDHGEAAMLRSRIVQTLRKNNISVEVKARRMFLVGEAAQAF